MKETAVAIARILLVDDDDVLLSVTAALLETTDFEVTTASNVPDALKLISSHTYDVLLSDLHMPGKGDGLTVVSAMRHANPNAVTILLSAFPEMDAATRAILKQADQIIVKPVPITKLVEVVKQRLESGPAPLVNVESVATILENSIPQTVAAWYERLEANPNISRIPMSHEARVGHIPKILMDLAVRLRAPSRLGSAEILSSAAVKHGQLRRQQGYSAAMMVEESRMLQVSIFETLKRNIDVLDFSVLLDGVMSIADEVDFQLAQQMTSYIDESKRELIPA
jgi:CheY-like chemotaxis protein